MNKLLYFVAIIMFSVVASGDILQEDQIEVRSNLCRLMPTDAVFPLAYADKNYAALSVKTSENAEVAKVKFDDTELEYAYFKIKLYGDFMVTVGYSAKSDGKVKFGARYDAKEKLLIIWRKTDLDQVIGDVSVYYVQIEQ